MNHPLILISASLLLLSATWRSADLPPGMVADIAAHPTIPGLAFALTSSGIYRSVDGGKRWDRVSDVSLYALSFVPVHALAFDPFDERELCALGDSAMACTVDLGITWSSLPKPGVTFVLFDPRTQDRLFMGTPYGMNWVYVSNDHGRSWNARGSLDVHPWFHGSAAVDIRTGSLLETGSPHGGCIPFCSIFRSDDAGSTWREIVAHEDAWLLAADRSGRSVLYVAISDSMNASGDLGATFALRGRVPVTATALTSDPRNVDLIYAGGDSGMLFQSADGGSNWTRIDQSQIAGRITHISAGADGVLYIATDDHIFTLRSANKRRAVRR